METPQSLYTGTGQAPIFPVSSTAPSTAPALSGVNQNGQAAPELPHDSKNLPITTGHTNIAPTKADTAPAPAVAVVSRPIVTQTSYGYEEFFGGEITCPTCQGAGKISREFENELVALIPMSDKRLRPRRTLVYVLISVIVCVIVAGLLLFFLFPRPVNLKNTQQILTPQFIDYNATDQMSITVTNTYNISNENFFGVEIRSLEVKLLFAQKILANVKNDSHLYVPMRSTLLHYITLNATFQDPYIKESCMSLQGRVLLIPFQATATFFYFNKEEQTTLNTYQYIRCHKDKEQDQVYKDQEQQNKNHGQQIEENQQDDSVDVENKNKRSTPAMASRPIFDVISNN